MTTRMLLLLWCCRHAQVQDAKLRWYLQYQTEEYAQFTPAMHVRAAANACGPPALAAAGSPVVYCFLLLRCIHAEFDLFHVYYVLTTI
jgi:hypothetical protein